MTSLIEVRLATSFSKSCLFHFYSLNTTAIGLRTMNYGPCSWKHFLWQFFILSLQRSRKCVAALGSIGDSLDLASFCSLCTARRRCELAAALFAFAKIQSWQHVFETVIFLSHHQDRGRAFQDLRSKC